MRKLLRRGKKLTTGITCWLLLLRFQDTFFILKSNRHQVTHLISKVQLHCNSKLFFFFLLQMNKDCKFNKNSTNTFLSQWYTCDDKGGLLQYCQVQKKFPHSLCGYLVFLAAIQNLCVFIPQLLQESLDMWCGTLAGKHCHRARD